MHIPMWGSVSHFLLQQGSEITVEEGRRDLKTQKWWMMTKKKTVFCRQIRTYEFAMVMTTGTSPMLAQSTQNQSVVRWVGTKFICSRGATGF